MSELHFPSGPSVGHSIDTTCIYMGAGSRPDGGLFNILK